MLVLALPPLTHLGSPLHPEARNSPTFYTYTALSSAKDDNRMKIVAWDRNRNLVKELEKPGARYLWNITFNAGNQTVTFTRQSNQSVQATLDDLVVRPAVVYLPSSSGPILPYTLTYAAADPSRFPVIKNGPYSFWPVSFKDGRNSFCIAVADRDNLVQKLMPRRERHPGCRH